MALAAGRTGLIKVYAQETKVSAWVIIHWFELGTLVLLGLNLWFVSAVLNALRETNRWIVFLSRVQWEQTHEAPTGSTSS